MTQKCCQTCGTIIQHHLTTLSTRGCYGSYTDHCATSQYQKPVQGCCTLQWWQSPVVLCQPACRVRRPPLRFLVGGASGCLLAMCRWCEVGRGSNTLRQGCAGAAWKLTSILWCAGCSPLGTVLMATSSPVAFSSHRKTSPSAAYGDNDEHEDNTHT